MYKFIPIVKKLVWGTEYWVVSGVPGNESVISDGPCAGKNITDIYPGQFPLLIKFIDAISEPSIQVHPNDEIAAKRHGCKGKTEMWYVTGAAKGATLLSGLKTEITPDDYVRLVEKDEIVSVLAEHEVSEGDVYFLPAGRIHAIGGGCSLAEIQQTSDITYRIYDYGRVGLDGKPRQLHTQEAKDAIDYTVYPDYRTHYVPAKDKLVEVVNCPYFVTSVLDLSKAFELPLDNVGDFVIVIALEGEAALKVGTGETCQIAAGEAVLVPVSDMSAAIVPQTTAKFLVTHV